MRSPYNKGLNAAELSSTFVRERRIQIRAFLPLDAAIALAKASEAIDWRLVFNSGQRHVDLPYAQIELAGRERMDAIVSEIGKNAAHGFQYLYENYPVADLASSGQLHSPELNAVYEAMNAPETLEFIRTLTGLPCDFCDMQATRYSAGHFLTVHSDEAAGKNRVLAYVLGLTPRWSPVWGGQLQFVDALSGSVLESYVPVFNALSLFVVPSPHHVSQVASFAPHGRVSLTGWFRRHL